MLWESYYSDGNPQMIYYCGKLLDFSKFGKINFLAKFPQFIFSGFFLRFSSNFFFKLNVLQIFEKITKFIDNCKEKSYGVKRF